MDPTEDEQNVGSNGQKTFNIDNIVEIILGYLKFKDLVNSRLINSCCNKNALRILSPSTRQSILRAFKIPHRIEKFEKLLKNSQNLNLFRSLDFKWDGKKVQDLEKAQEILQITQPTELTLKFNQSYKYEEQLKIYQFIIDILPLLCSNIIKLEIIGFITDTDSAMVRIGSLKNLNFPQDQIIFPKLQILYLKSEMPSEYFEHFEDYFDKIGDFIEIFTKNSPNLSDIIIPYVRDSSSFASVDKLKSLEIQFHDEKIQVSSELLKLNHLLKLSSFKIALLPCEGMFLTDCGKFNQIKDVMKKGSSEFSNLRKFLEGQSNNLTNLELKIFLGDSFDATVNDYSDSEDEFGTSDEKRRIFSLKLPTLEKLRDLSIFYKETDIDPWRDETEIWPLQPINLPLNCPNLRKISLNYSMSQWKENFEINFPCETVREIILHDSKHGHMELSSLTRYFPNVTNCKFLVTCDQNLVYPVKFDGLSGWSNSLTNITIDLSPEKLEDFDFEQLVDLHELSEICIRKSIICERWSMLPVQISSVPVRPNFMPLFKIRKLSKLTIKYFKIADHVLNEIYQRFPTLEYKA